MVSSRKVPVLTLALVLASAAAVLVVGVIFSREVKTVAVEQDRAPLTGFTTELLDEIRGMEDLYESRLLDIREKARRNRSSIFLSSLSRNIVGIEQVSLLGGKDTPLHLDLREGQRVPALPVPRLQGDESSGDGVLVDPKQFRDASSGTSSFWIAQAGHPPHFVARLDYQSYVVFRIDPGAVADEMNSRLESWVGERFSPVTVAGLSAAVRGPADEVLVRSDDIAGDTAPSLLLPVRSRFGQWKVVARDKFRTVTEYRQPVLVGAAALSVLLVVAGLIGFLQQRRALRLAEQRVSFANRVSHELRTPLTNILLNIDLATDALRDESESSPAGKRLGHVREEAGRLSRLLDNVLTFSRRENTADALRIAPCDVTSAVDEVLDQFAPSLRHRKLEARVSRPTEPVFALADPDALRQIVGNLVSNVEKYAAAANSFEIAITESEADGTVTIAVTDRGPGIAKAQAGRIFRPFTRLDDRTTEGASGTGLGLAIARDLARALHGSLALVPTASGARFELTLPRADESGEASAKAEAPNVIPIAS